MGFLSAGFFYGAVATFLVTFLPKEAADWGRNAMILAFMTLTLISVTMGKGINKDMRLVLAWLKIISVFFILVNIALVLSAVTVLILGKGLFVTILIVSGFFASYILPPFIFDLKATCCSPIDTLCGIVCYMCSMPIYLIIFQLFSYSNIHDVSWGNREASVDTKILK
jgi:hypothetical protein